MYRSFDSGSEAVASAIRIEGFLTLAANDAAAAVSYQSTPGGGAASRDQSTVAGDAAASATAASAAAINQSTGLSEKDDGSAALIKTKGKTSYFTLKKNESDASATSASTAQSDAVQIAGSITGTEEAGEKGENGENGEGGGKVLISIPRSCYYYTDPSSPVLSDITLSVRAGELILIAGPVGAGKSSLLSVILGEMKRCAGGGGGDNRNNDSDGSNGRIDTRPLGGCDVSQACGAGDDAAECGVERTAASTTSLPTVSSLPPYSSAASSSCSSSSCPSSSSSSRIAYCTQRPWILAASVQQNITIAGKTGDQSDPPPPP